MYIVHLYIVKTSANESLAIIKIREPAFSSVGPFFLQKKPCNFKGFIGRKHFSSHENVILCI